MREIPPFTLHNYCPSNFKLSCLGRDHFGLLFAPTLVVLCLNMGD
jgi:hypothetical protein